MSFEPITAFAALAAAGSLASAGIGAAGAIHSGRASQAAAEFNAATMTQQAARDKAISDIQAQQYFQEGRKQLATMRTARLASGVQMTGSPLIVDEHARDEFAYNWALIRAGGDARATRLVQQAELERFGGRSARLSGMFRAGSSLLQGAGNVGMIGMGFYERNPLRSEA